MKSCTSSFGPTRYSYLYEQLRRINPVKHLDVGCFDGYWLSRIAGKLQSAVYGVDLNGDAIVRGQAAYPALRLSRIDASGRLPFEDDTFDTISLLDVFEHLDTKQQDEILGEIWRVLKPGGAFIITVPGSHFFSFLDTGNWKFCFPAVHRLFVTARHGKEFYEKRYVSNEFGLVGDVSTTKRWHEHFRPADLVQRLGRSGFVAIDQDGSGFFGRIFALFDYCLPMRPLRTFIRKVHAADAAAFQSANVFLTVQKPASDHARREPSRVTCGAQ